MPNSSTVIQIGNFQPEHSTENHLRRALIENGHVVIPMQENDPGTFLAMSNRRTWPGNPDFILWTRTGWDWKSIYGDGGEAIAHGLQRAMLGQAKLLTVPTVSYHLDIWFGLPRVHQIGEPFFESDLVITADGGHDEEFAGHGVNHVWFPPGVSRAECRRGTFRDEYHSKLAFVGSHDGSYHKEHEHRHELVAWLKKNFRRDCSFWPQPGCHAVRGRDLQDLYASVDIVIGDSCFAGTGLPNYWSDRVPETLGRGGLLLHPEVPGLVEAFHGSVITWPAFDWEALGALIEKRLVDRYGYNSAAKARGRLEVLEHHTYERRMAQLVELLQERDTIS